MANVRKSEKYPEASTKGITTLVLKYDKAEWQNPKSGKTTHYLDAQVLQTEGANPQLPRQVGPSFRISDDPERPNQPQTSMQYSDSQMDAIIEAAGDNAQRFTDKDGNEVGTAYVVDADVMFKEVDKLKSAEEKAAGAEASGRDKVMVMNTKSLRPAPEGLVIPENVREAQFQAVAENREARKEAEAAKAAEAPAPEAEAPAKEAAEAPAKTDDELEY